MTRMMLLLPLLVFLGLISPLGAGEKHPVLEVWPGKVPGEKTDLGPEKLQEPRPKETKPVQRWTNISRPTLTIYRPAKEKDTGAAVIICPGGGYNILAWDLEGTEVAEWLNSIGVTGIVLKYRVPRRPEQPKEQPPIGPLQDAQRSLSLVRSKAKELGIDPTRIGILGFSAGGHLATTAAINFDQRAYEKIDELDRTSCRPDFAVLIYPAYLTTKDGKELNPGLRVRKECPPTFLAHAANDPIKADNSLLLALALRRAGVPAEVHVYATGGHGFGLRPSANPCSTWPQRCAEWLNTQGWLKKAPRGGTQSSCAEEQTGNVIPSPDAPRLVAHRGLLRHAPENTLAAFGACIDLRLGFELDVRRTRDGRLVCLHDATVKRTTNGQDAVADLTLAELRKLDAGLWFDPLFRGAQVPTLAEVFALLRERRATGVLVALDLKCDDEKLEADVVALARQNGVLGQVVCIGRAITEPAVRQRLRAADGQAPVAVLAQTAKDVPAALAEKNADWIYVRFVPTAEQVTALHRAGKKVFLSGPAVAGQEPENWRRAREAGVDALLTDYPLDCRRVWRGAEAR